MHTVHRPVRTLLLAAAISGLSLTTASAFELAAPFADHAIVQQGMNVPVWGWGKPGEKITVAFAGQTKTATVGADGKWRVALDPLKASFDPRAMTVTGGGKTATINDVLVGEVWMATGQSNMQWITSKADVGRMMLPKIMADVEAGKINKPVVREGRVTDFYSALQPVRHASFEWSSDVGNFSAIATAFAYKLATELNVPVGIVNGSFSTTSIQAWIPVEGFVDGTDEFTQAHYQRVLEGNPTTPQHKAAWDKFYQDIDDTIAANKKRVAAGQQPEAINTHTPGNLSGNRDSTWMFNGRLGSVVPYAIRGCIWNQGYASQGDGLNYYHHLHSLVRGWRIVWERPDLPVYFHQFYRGGNSANGSLPTLSSTSEMRLGTWLARDIPNTGMASQIDIGGGIHYTSKAVPGQRLALHALKNQYGKHVVADGPMFKRYTVKGNQLIVEFDHADGGLVVGLTNPKTMAVPQPIPNGEDQVKLFYIADANRVWYPATVKLQGNKAILTSPKVSEPRGVSYAAEGVGFQPNLYNKAMLPATPFIQYDNKMVTSRTWPDDAMKIDGVEPPVVGLPYEYRKMPLLSTQFRDNAVLQAGQPVTIWGSAVHPYVHFGAEDTWSKGKKAVIHFSFGDITKTIPVTDGMLEWQVTLPPMQATAKGRKLDVKFTLDGELIHERSAENIVFGDVWYVAAPEGKLDAPVADSGQPVRMMANHSKRWRNGSPSRFSVAVSTTPGNRFAAEWKPATGFAAALGHRIAAKTGKPVGIIFMQTKSAKGETDQTQLKHWIAADDLRHAPSLLDDYKQLAALKPGNDYYDANARRYVAAWKKYWGQYIPQLMATGTVPDARPWGSYPTLAGDVTTTASQTYNVFVHSFTPAALKGIVFIPGDATVKDDQGAHFGEQMAALANGWRQRFGGEPAFVYALPGKKLAPKITAAKGIDAGVAVEVDAWPAAGGSSTAIIDAVMANAYR